MKWLRIFTIVSSLLYVGVNHAFAQGNFYLSATHTTLPSCTNVQVQLQATLPAGATTFTIDPGSRLEIQTQLLSSYVLSPNTNGTLDLTVSDPNNFTTSITLTLRALPTGDYTSCNAPVTVLAHYPNGTTATHTLNLTLTAQPLWNVQKTAVGMVNCNTVRYQISIFSDSCNGVCNLYNAQLLELPSSGGIMQNPDPSDPQFINSATTTLPNPLVRGNVYNYFVDIQYPNAVVGSQVGNAATLNASTPEACGPPAATKARDFTKNVSSAFTIAPFTHVKMPSLSKGTDNSRNNAPGCQNMYIIHFRNNTSNNIQNLVITDLFPANLVTMMSGINSNVPVTSYTINGGSPVLLNAMTTGPLTLGSAPASIALDFGNIVFLPNDEVNITIPFTINSGLTIGTTVHNEVTAVGNGFSLYTTDLCTGTQLTSYFISLGPIAHDFQVQNVQPRPLISKSVSSPTLTPGQTATFKVCISNYGGNGFTTQFQDQIDQAVFNSPTNIRVYVDDDEPSECSVDAAHSSNVGGVTYNAGTGLLSGSFSVSAQCQMRHFSNVIIVYDAVVKGTAQPCSYKNTATVSGSFTGSPISAEVPFTVDISSKLSYKKTVSLDGISFANQVFASPGQTVWYKVELQNNSSTSITNLRICDNLPYAGDGRGSTTSLSFAGSAYTPASGATGNFFTTQIPAPAGTPPACPAPTGGNGSSSGKIATLINLGSFILTPGNLTTVIYKAVVDASAPNASVARNTAIICGAFSFPPGAGCIVPALQNNELLPGITDTATIVIRRHEIACCNGKQFQYTQTSPITLTTRTSNFSSLQTNFQITYNNTDVQQLRVSVADLQISYDQPGCAQENTQLRFLGTMEKLQCSPQIGTLPYSLAPSIYHREIVYGSNTTPSQDFTGGLPLQLKISLPTVRAVSCCAMRVRVVLKFSFRDSYCNECVFYQTLPEQVFQSPQPTLQ
jgi:uncharacterized repeat protein (TIGR01451 family)